MMQVWEGVNRELERCGTTGGLRDVGRCGTGGEWGSVLVYSSSQRSCRTGANS